MTKNEYIKKLEDENAEMRRIEKESTRHIDALRTKITELELWVAKYKLETSKLNRVVQRKCNYIERLRANMDYVDYVADTRDLAIDLIEKISLQNVESWSQKLAVETLAAMKKLPRTEKQRLAHELLERVQRGRELKAAEREKVAVGGGN